MDFKTAEEDYLGARDFYHAFDLDDLWDEPDGPCLWYFLPINTQVEAEYNCNIIFVRKDAHGDKILVFEIDWENTNRVLLPYATSYSGESTHAGGPASVKDLPGQYVGYDPLGSGRIQEEAAKALESLTGIRLPPGRFIFENCFSWRKVFPREKLGERRMFVGVEWYFRVEWLASEWIGADGTVPDIVLPDGIKSYRFMTFEEARPLIKPWLPEK